MDITNISATHANEIADICLPKMMIDRFFFLVELEFSYVS